MNYPITVKKVFTRIRFSAHDVWQNLRDLKRSISSLVRNIDDVGACVTRSREILRGLHGNKTGDRI
jgi:hypothetical protein